MNTGHQQKPNRSRSSVMAHDGFGLVEAMIAAAVISIIALGLATTMENMAIMQRKTSLVGVIQAQRARIIASVQKGAAWELTTGDVDTGTGNPLMVCMNGGTACTHGTVTALNLKDETGAAVYSARTANHGFTDQGVLCSNYPTSPCSFRWNLTWTALCPSGSGTCLDPNVRVLGTIAFTAGNVAIPGGFNPALYAIDVLRGAEAVRNDPVMVSYVLPGTTGEGNGCDRVTLGDGVWAVRKLNTVVADPGNNLTNKTGAVLTPGLEDRVRLRAGVYTCRVQAPAWKNDGNRIRLRSTSGTTLVVMQSSVAHASMLGGSANVILDVTLNLTAETTFVVEHMCTSRPTASSYGQQRNDWAMGVPGPDSAGNYTNAVYTTVSCTRTS